MTTNNPDPLEVAMLIGPFELKIRNQENYSGEHREWYETVTVPQGNPYVAKAAAAIIAQHYAPVIAENERLREEVIQYRRVIERLRDFDGWVGTYHAGHAYDAKQDALALLGAKP